MSFTHIISRSMHKMLASVFVLLMSSLVFSMHVLAENNLSYADLSLQNLERERAALIQDLLSPNLDIEQRKKLLIKRQRQLSDMERMVIRDERLLSSRSTLVKNAFSQYELTFLVHAGAENKLTASEHWLSTMNITNAAILDAQVGYRK